MKVKSFGGKRNKAKKVWELSYEAVKSLGLEKRIVREKNPIRKKDGLSLDKPP